jgi:hypothetical protein
MQGDVKHTTTVQPLLEHTTVTITAWLASSRHEQVQQALLEERE